MPTTSYTHTAFYEALPLAHSLFHLNLFQFNSIIIFHQHYHTWNRVIYCLNVYKVLAMAFRIWRLQYVKNGICTSHTDPPHLSSLSLTSGLYLNIMFCKCVLNIHTRSDGDDRKICEL